jgi:outer membrane receptor protein involved in Fe transport
LSGSGRQEELRSAFRHNALRRGGKAGAADPARVRSYYRGRSCWGHNTDRGRRSPQDIAWALTDSLTIRAAATYLQSELTGATIPDTSEGTRLPVAPELKLDLNARYEFPLGNWEGFLQGNVSYVGDRTIDIRDTEATLIGTLPDYTIVDASMGISQNGLSLSLFVDNLFDERAITGRYIECAIGTCFGEHYNVVARPMTAGIRFGREF